MFVFTSIPGEAVHDDMAVVCPWAAKKKKILDAPDLKMLWKTCFSQSVCYQQISPSSVFIVQGK